jgi:hypothetical protein
MSYLLFDSTETELNDYLEVQNQESLKRVLLKASPICRMFRHEEIPLKH